MANETIEVLRIPGTLFPRGPFDENAAYKFLNFVESGGNGYVCLQPCTGIPVTNTAYWFKFVFKGDKGDAFTYADLTAEQKAELVRDATAAAQAAASSAQSAADDAAAALQKFNTIKAAIDAIDPQSTEGSIQTLAAKQGLLEADLNALGPKIEQVTDELKSKFGGEINVTSLPNSGYVNIDGSVYPSANHNYSNPILLDAGDTITISSTGNGFSVLSETNSSGSTYTSLKGASGSVDTSVTYTYTANEAIYVCVTARTASTYSIQIDRSGTINAAIETNRQNILANTEDIEEIQNVLPTKTVVVSRNVPSSDMEQGLVDGSGSKSSNSKRIRTKNPIDLTDVTEIGLLDNTTYSFWIRFFNSSNSIVLTWDLAGMNPNSNAAATTAVCNINTIRTSYPTIAYAYVVVRKIVDGDLPPTETFYVKRNEIEVEEIAGVPTELHDYALNLEYGGIKNNGAMTDCDDSATFFTTLRTKNLVKLRNFSLSLSSCTAKIFLYAHDFSLVGAVDYSASFDISEYKATCSYYKIAFAISSGWTISFQTAEYEEIKNSYTANAVSFLYEVTPCNGRDLSATDVEDESPSDYTSQLVTTKYYNSGLLRLPPNYQPNGVPTKMIMWAHGSGWYGSMVAHDFNTSYLDYIKYLQKEGYAIFDCYGASSKYGDTGNNALANPTNMACIFSAYRWIIEHYNIDTNGIYVSSKSLGGIVAAAMLFQNSIPVKACCPLAPELDPRSIQLGYTERVRIDYCDDMGFIGADVVVGTSSSTPMTDEVFETLLSANESQMCGFVPPLCGVVSPTIAELAPYPAKNIAYNNVRRVCKVPLKIFIAADDTAVNYNACKYFVKSIKATGGIAELRTMPSNTGGHHAVDYGDDAHDKPSIKVDITTALGYECEDVPLAWAEMVQFFRRFN